MATLCISGAALAKAGKNVSASLSAGTILISGAYIVDHWINQAEGFINVSTKKNWNNVYSTLDADKKYILEDTAACLAGMDCINWDMSGYTSRTEAETMLDYLRDRIGRNIGMLNKDQARTALEGTAGD